ncbi:hypothetical protein EJB05_33467 [Eragrostis curvula]|uniref:Uncharacterized protein n=1 Tax=Eragrostis curvula TaxID=38414 RepID=A0A5J9U2Z7_9POAL|nr:hypothetical protein EJB05_33467 [Eragrostis curvula]
MLAWLLLCYAPPPSVLLIDITLLPTLLSATSALAMEEGRRTPTVCPASPLETLKIVEQDNANQIVLHLIIQNDVRSKPRSRSVGLDLDPAQGGSYGFDAGLAQGNCPNSRAPRAGVVELSSHAAINSQSSGEVRPQSRESSSNDEVA